MAHSDNQTSSQTSKESIRSDGKSEGIRKSTRVVDMSWAADYLDDTWENEHAAKGAYDTQVLPPLKKYMQTDAAGVNPLSTTQEFKAVPGDETADDLHIVDAVTDRTIATKEEVLEVRQALHRAQPEGWPEEAKDASPGKDDELKIRDAVTDQTVASMEEARAVRRAAAFFDLKEDMDERAPLRDALSGSRPDSKSDTSGSDDMAKVRAALASTPKMPAFLSRASVSSSFQPSGLSMSSGSFRSYTDEKKSAAGLKAPAAVTSTETSRPFTAEENSQARAAGLSDQEEPVRPEITEKPELQEEQEKTIVASKDVRNVRKAASDADASRFRLEKMFRDDEIDPEQGEEDRYDQYEDIDDYDDYDDLDDPDDIESPAGYDDSGDYDDFDDLDDGDDFDTYDEADRYYGPDDDYDRHEKSRKRPGKYYYGYKQPRNPLRFIPLVLVVAICVLGFIVAMQICHDVPLNASDYSKVKYTVEAGLTDEQLSEDLQALGIIDNPLVFRLRCKFYSADYVPGTYELSPCYSTEKIINILSGYTYGTDD